MARASLVEVSKADAHALDAMQRKLLPNEGAFGDDVWLAPDVTAYWISVEGRIVGIVVTQSDVTVGENYDDDPPSAPGSLYLLLIGCVEEARRQGFALQALEALKQIARGGDYAYIVSNLRPSNVASEKLHRKAGFTEDGTKLGYYPPPHLENTLVMRFMT